MKNRKIKFNLPAPLLRKEGIRIKSLPFIRGGLGGVLVLSGILVFLSIFSIFGTAHAALILQRPNYTGLNQGLVGYWSFDGKDTTSTTATDRSGNNNNGTLTNGPLPVQGKIGQALSFDGSNDELTTTNSFLDPQTFSISVWFKTTSASGKKLVGFESAQTGTGSTSYDRHIYMGTDGKIYFGWYPGFTVTVVSSATLNNGQWHHAVGTHNGSTGILYIDEVLQGSNTGSPQSYTGWWRIGDYKLASWTNASDGYFPGSIDDVRIYNRVLSADEIKRLYKIGGTLHTNVSINTDSLQKGLVGYWSFDGKDTTSTTATDRSGNGNNGTLTNGPLPAQGKIGQALQLDGSNDYVSIPLTQSLNISTNISISAWIKIDTWKESDIVEAGSSGYMLWTAPSQSNKILWGRQSAAQQLPSSTAFNNKINQWIHIVGTNDGSVLRFYVNGVLDASQSVATSFSNSTVTLGTGLDGYFKGSIDDVRIYNRVLSADEIKRLYKIGGTLHVNTSNVGNNDTLKNGLVGYWTFDGNDTTSTTATDRSGNGNNGTLTNGPLPAQGKIGQALSFDGSNMYVNTGSGSSIPIIAPVTVSAWIKGSGTILGKWNDPTFRYSILFGSTDCYFTNQANTDVYKVSYTIPSTEWHFVACSMIGNSQNAYRDGVFVATGASNFPSTVSGSTALLIGVQNTSGGSFNGQIDDVRIYNRALTSDEIKRLYNLGR